MEKSYYKEGQAVMFVSLFLCGIVLSLLVLMFSEKSLKKSDWQSEISFVRWSQQSVLVCWIVYFILELESPERNIFRKIIKDVVSRVEGVVKFPFKEFYRNYSLTFLLIITLICVLINGILFLYKKHCHYKSLDNEEFPEYDFDFQVNLVDFLNSKPQFGQNIYWLDGEWGTGKTHFLRTFFQRQSLKKLEIYYVSCFGITSREQAEQVLIREIEERSSLGSLDYIPVISSLVKWGFKTLELDLMKKDSVVIFDDLERVSYNYEAQDKSHGKAQDKSHGKSQDKPENYNALLGFIDYLANHKNQKVIVVYNSSDMEGTTDKIIKKKFSPIENKMLPVDDVIYKIIEKNGDLMSFSHQFLGIIYKIKINFGSENLRALLRDISKYRNVENSWEELKEFILEFLNGILPIFKSEEIFDFTNNRPERIDFFYWSEFVNQTTKPLGKHYQLYVELAELIRTKLDDYPNLRNLVLGFDRRFSFEKIKDDSLLGQEIMEHLWYKNKIKGTPDLFLPVDYRLYFYHKINSGFLDEITSVTKSSCLNKEFVNLLYSREYISDESQKSYILEDLGKIMRLLQDELSSHRMISSLESLSNDFYEYLSNKEDTIPCDFMFEINPIAVGHKVDNHLSKLNYDEINSLYRKQIAERLYNHYQANLVVYEKLLRLLWRNNLKDKVVELIENLQEKRGRKFTDADRDKIKVYFDSQGENIA